VGELIHLADRPEFKAALIQRLADLDQQLEPLEREAEIVRRALGLVALERGLEP